MAHIRTWTLACIAGLAALTVVRQLLLDPIPNPATNTIWLVLQLALLLVVLPGLLRNRPTPYFFAIMVGLLFFVHGVLTSAGEQRLLGFAETALAVGLVACASFGLRAARRALAQ